MRDPEVRTVVVLYNLVAFLAEAGPLTGATFYATLSSGLAHGETFTFYANVDDDIHLTINGDMVLGRDCCGEVSGEYYLEAGEEYDLEIEYYQAGGPGHLKLAEDVWETVQKNAERFGYGKLRCPPYGLQP